EYVALTVLGKLLRLWGKMFGWEPSGSREERRSPPAARPLSQLLAALDKPQPPPQQQQHPSSSSSGPSSSPPGPPLSQLLVDNLGALIASTARTLQQGQQHLQRREGREEPAAATITATTTGSFPSPEGGAPPLPASAAPSPPASLPLPPGYQATVGRYLSLFRLVGRCKESYVAGALVEAVWDCCVAGGNTRQDREMGLALVMACCRDDQE
ncbi:hypothetical protein Agub_g1097, partial [Astrephomene gubernaculifera]